MKFKLTFTVPVAQADAVREAIGEAGAGKLGNYSFCTFSIKGTGRFKPEPGAHPAIGEVGRLEAVEEEQIETVCEEESLPNILAALKKAHPYEEVAYDLVPLHEIGSKQN